MPPDYHNMLKPRRQAPAIQAAREAIEDVARLSVLSGKETLTRNQQDDFERACARWNRAVEDFPETARSIAPVFTTSNVTIDTATAATVAFKMAEADERGDAVRSASEKVLGKGGLANLMDPRTGRASEDTSPGKDTLRDQWESREYIHDYTIPTNEEVRTVTDFANNAALFMNDFETQMAIYQRTASPWLAISTIINSDNGRPIVVPQLTGDPTVYTPGEGTAITASDAVLASVTVTPVGYKALMYVSNEAFEDSEVPLSQIVARAQSRAIGLAFGSAATTAVLASINNAGTATGLGGGGGTAGTALSPYIGYEDLISLKYSRAAPYRGAAVWIMSNGLIVKVRKWKDGQGDYLLPPSSADNLDGQPVYEDPYLLTPGSASKSVIYGDASAGLIIKSSQLRIEMSRDFKFDTDVTAIKTVHRLALAVQDPAALAFEVSANS